MKRQNYLSFLGIVFTLCLGFVANGQSIMINGQDPVCKGSTHQYDIAADPDNTYVWVTNNKGYIASSTPDIAFVTWGMDGTGVVKVYEYSNNMLIDSGVLSVTILPEPEPIITTNTIVDCQVLGKNDPSDQPPSDFDSSDCIQVCAYSCVKYFVKGGTGSSYTWSVAGGSINQDWGDSVEVCWNGPGFGSVTVKETNSDGCEGESSICLIIIEAPIARPRFMLDTTQTSITICDSSELHFVDLSIADPNSPIVTWRWDFGDGTYSNAQSAFNAPISHKYEIGSSTTIWAKLTVTNKCGCSTTDSVEIEIVSQDKIEIVCPRVVCEGDTIMYSASPPCSTGRWHVINGTNNGGSSSSIEVIWDMPDGSGFGYVTYQSYCGASCGPIIAKVPVVGEAGQITGPDIVCPDGQYIYKMPQWPTTDFDWSLVTANGATLAYANHTNEIILNTGGTETLYVICDFTNTLLGCGGTDTITVEVLDTTSILGPKKVCHNTNARYRLTGTHTGDWVLDGPGGTQTTNNSNVFVGSFNDVGDYTLSVTGSTFCTPDPIHIRVDDLPPIPDWIDGPDTFCKGVPTKFEAGDPLTGTIFTWVVLNGTANAASGNTSEITMNPLSSGPFEIYVFRETKSEPHCKSDTLSKLVYPPDVNLGITGSNTPCINTTYPYEAGYSSAEVYEWRVYPDTMGSVVDGDNTPYANILWNNDQGSAFLICNMRKCDSLYRDTLSVTIGGVPTAAMTITSSPVCENSQFNVSISNASDVNFNFGDNNINYPAGGDNMDYTYTNLNNVTATKYPITAYISLDGCNADTTIIDSITVDPAPFGDIDPKVHIDCGAFSETLTYTIDAGLSISASSYQWYLNGSPVGSSLATHSATAYGWYWLEVTGSNGCTWISDSIPVLENCPCVLATDYPHVPWSPTISVSTPTVTNCNQINLVGNLPSPVPLTPGFISYDWRAITNAQHVTGWTGLSATTASAIVDEAGYYKFEYEVAYEDTFGTICAYKAYQWALVPYIAEYNVSHTCDDSNGNWRRTIISNSSRVFTSLTFIEFTVDGNVVQSGTANSWAGYLSPGTHTFKLRIADANNDTCEVTNTYDVEWPNADFTWDRPISCAQEATVSFTNTSTGGSVDIWDFGDNAQNRQPHPYRVYSIVNASPGHPVTLWIEDQWGCRDSITQNVPIVEDSLIGTIDASPLTPCQGEPVTLSYIPDLGTNYPALYTWYSQLDVIANTTYQPITVYESGYYWIYGEDNTYGCIVNTDPEVVVVTKVPPAFVSGKEDQCVDVPFTLSGYAGSDPSIMYTWLLGGTAIAGPSGTKAILTETKSSSGTYNYQVVITINKPGGGTCADTSDVFAVEVHNSPAAPSLSFNITDCDIYEVELMASPPDPGTYNWSNGLFGTTVYAYYGGPFQVTYTDTFGCRSKADILVPEDPRAFLWVFPTGCFTICPSNSYTITGNDLYPFANWDYQELMAGSVHSGTGRMVPDYTTLNTDAPGTFNLTLDNGYCQATSGDMIVDTNCETGTHIKPGATSIIRMRNDASLQQWNNEPGTNAAMSLAPNPASNSVRIDYIFNEKGPGRMVEVYDVTGRLLSRHDATKHEGSWVLNLDRYAPGMYQVVLKQQGKVLLQSKLSVLKY